MVAHTIVGTDPLNPTVRKILEKALAEKRVFLEVHLDEQDHLTYRQGKVLQEIQQLRVEIVELEDALKDVPTEG